MALTNTWLATSFEPATTKAFPFAANNSLATNRTALSALGLFANFLLPGNVAPDMALYKLTSAIPSSDGLMGIRTSALVPVTLIPVSNWIWRDIFLFCSDLL